MENSFRDRLRRGERLYGTMITQASPSIAEVLSLAGFDWFFIDGEHGPLEIPDILGILQAVGHRTACIVRVPEAAEVPIKKVLDIGAAGIIVPQVNSAAQAAEVVNWARYAPQGARGIGLARAHGYGATFQEYLDSANDEVAVIVQTEHIQAVNEIEDIVSVPGIDAIQLGPYDLSASMGKTGQIDDPDVVAALQKIYAAAHNAMLPVGCFGITAKHVQADIERGATLICAGVDSTLLSHAAKSMLGKLTAP